MQLTVQEPRHKLARDICHGKKGTIHQAYRDGMEDQLGSLGLVLNAVVLWTTRYIDAAAGHPASRRGPRDQRRGVARLSPLKHKNLNCLGRYSFTATQPSGGTLRPLRDPDAAGLDDDEDGAE
ncbi:Tn3 family transposase [Streptomyces lydicus]|uniref:Tn3 family transposase n=1 Tax=Streptomyces lydicus TaxID=47763 RepID=UPI0037886F0B